MHSIDISITKKAKILSDTAMTMFLRKHNAPSDTPNRAALHTVFVPAFVIGVANKVMHEIWLNVLWLILSPIKLKQLIIVRICWSNVDQ